MSQWDRLLGRALKGIDALEQNGTPLKWWSLGGGTALMLHLWHRDSKDIDIFVPDPQVLSFLSPRLHAVDIWETPAYDEAAHYIKLRFEEGEIDFIATSAVSDSPNMPFSFAGRNIQIESPAEIILKKLRYRGDTMKPRDIFDMAVVLNSKYAETLVSQMHHVEDARSGVSKRLSSIDEQEVIASIGDLRVAPEWRHIIPVALRDVRDFVAATGVENEVTVPLAERFASLVDYASSPASLEHPLDVYLNSKALLAEAEAGHEANAGRMAGHLRKIMGMAAAHVLTCEPDRAKAVTLDLLGEIQAATNATTAERRPPSPSREPSM